MLAWLRKGDVCDGVDEVVLVVLVDGRKFCGVDES